MLETVTQTSIQDQILALALSSPERFPAFFRKYRDLYPEEVTHACLLHLSEHGSDKTGRQMMVWLCLSADYLPALLDPKLLSLEAARRAAAILCQADQQYLARLVNLGEQPDSLSVHRLLNRALELVDVVTNKDSLIPWLRQLTNSPDVRIRSKAVKALCELRPNPQLVERQLSSPDERIRANALEAIWRQQTPEAEELLRHAAHDPNHRVVANALVGLYLIGDKTAFDRIVSLAQHPSPMFRRAMIWALGYIRDERGIAILQSLSNKDQLPAVRNKALKTLALFPLGVPNTVPPPDGETDPLVSETFEPVPPENTYNNRFGDFKLTILS